MKKKFSTLGKQLTRTELRNVKGGCPGHHICDTYNGPIEVTCEQFHALPPEYQMCVDVAADCFE
ncbi:MAG TPA: hypothetical protein DCS93_09140 [Microscillaceae bacterium]|nr:hypothetical protein [Microscillaceae bacterium]